MKIVWKGNWKKGEISIEVETLDELIGILEKLESEEAVSPVLPQKITVETPQIPGNVGPTEAVRQALGSSWGRAEPRTMTEIAEVLEANALYFSQSTLSGVLTNMTKKGELRRPRKKAGKWAYVLSSS